MAASAAVVYDAQGQPIKAIRCESGIVWPSKRRDKTMSATGWKLHKGNGERPFCQHINFVRPFADPPAVFLGLSALDLLTEADHRISVQPLNVERTGFDIRFSTWRDSHVWSASASFLAFEKAPAMIDGARLETGIYAFRRTLSGWTLSSGTGNRRYSVRVMFTKTFVKIPKVIACISGLDVSKHEDHRLSVTVDSVSLDSFQLSAVTWSDSVVNGVTVAWLAVDADLEDSNGAAIKVGTHRFNNRLPAWTLDEGSGDREIQYPISFGSYFEKKPSGVVLLSAVDVSNEDDNRIKVIETGIYHAGFTLTCGTWRDTIVWGATASWLAFVDGEVRPAPLPLLPPLLPPSFPLLLPTLSAAVAPPSASVTTTSSTSASSDSAAAVQPSPKKPKVDGAQDNTAAGECTICYDAKINTVIVPCGHLCVCFECSKLLKPKIHKCPICRTSISQIIKTFMG
ncbi:hypothetical protein Pelo_2975 [Pelomyxa schiedti]|nr:hypothetical protein Pelo_2975 [Pelomyxa schiedti]